MKTEDNKDWRERLDQSESPMDTGKFWESLEHMIPAEPVGKKKRRLLIWLFLFLIGAGISGAYLIQSFDYKKVPQEPSGNSSDQIVSNATEHSNFLPQTRKSEVPIQESNEMSLPSLKQKVFTDYSENDPTIENKSFQSSLISAANSGESTERSLKQKNLAPEADKPSNTNPEARSDARKSISEMNVMNEQEHKPESAKTLLENDAINSSVQKLPGLPLGQLNETKLQLASMPVFEEFAKVKAENESWQYWMDLSYGVGLARHNFNSENASVQSYLENRSQYESQLESRFAFWENRLIHPSGFYVSTGLRYQSHVTRFDWSKEVSKMEWKLTDGFMQDAQGNQIPVRDSAWQTYRERRDVRHHNTISSLDIPVHVGYIMWKRDFSVEIAAGITANITQYTSGKHLDLNAQIMSWNSVSELTFKKYATGWGASGMLRATWYPTDFLGIFLQPSVQKDLSNRMPAEAGYRHSIDVIHIQAGITCKLFGPE